MSRATSPGATRRQLPPIEALPPGNDLSRVLFDERGADRALRFHVDGEFLYLVPWAARNGGVAGYREAPEAHDAWPVEVSGDRVRRLMAAQPPAEVPLAATPAWLLDDTDDRNIGVSWHARARWAERVEHHPAPANAIRDAYEKGVAVGIEFGKGRYYPPEDVVIASQRGEDPHVITVFRPESIADLQTAHLPTCECCGEFYEPGEGDECDCCGGRTCPWCGSAL